VEEARGHGAEQDIRKRCYYFSLEVLRFVDSIEFRKIHFSLIDQLLRSSTSIGANLIEARAAHSTKDFIKFYEIALKSANEAKYWLCLFRDGIVINNERVKYLLDEANQISKIVGAIVLKMKKNKKKFTVVSEQETEYFPF
jgi:four helix bundle protein